MFPSLNQMHRMQDWMGTTNEENSTASWTISHIQSSCYRNCSNEDCLQHSFQHQSDCYLKSGTNVTLADFYLNVTNFPFILIESHVFISQLELFITALNIICFWTAFSPFQIATDYASIFTDRFDRLGHQSLFQRKLMRKYGFTVQAGEK